MKYGAEIEVVQNGYILWLNGGESEQKIVIEEKESTHEGQHEAFMNLCHEIQDHFGVYYSKHQKSNCIIQMEKC